MLRSGLVVEVPEVESAVGAQRGRLDPHARLGVPPHVTALFPFVPPELIDGHILDRVRSVVRGVPAFDYRITHSAWFGDDVLWLAPQDDRLFRTLTALLSRAFPDYPPYGGEHADPVPHLTVADHAALADMRAAEQAVRPHLPISAAARHVSLLSEQESGRWTRQATFALGGD